MLLSSTVRELPGKSPKNFRGSSGNFRGSPGTFQKLRGARLPPSDSPNLSPNGGVEKKRGVENLMNDTPPKKGFWTPPRTVRFPPPSGQVSELCFFCKKKSTTEPTRSCFGGVQKFSGERVLWYVFLPPYILHPPPYRGPIFLDIHRRFSQKTKDFRRRPQETSVTLSASPLKARP